VESTLAVAAATWAIAMALGPVLQIRRIIDEQRSRGVSDGIAAINLTLIVPNAVAMRYR
jgi:hypothetical protein